MPVRRVMVATDRSVTAERAVHWAANLAAASQAELYLLQILPDRIPDGTPAQMTDELLGRATADLQEEAEKVAGSRGRARVIVASDLAQAIIDGAEEADADVLVVGNVGMSGRKEFLLGNIPNRISHNARCTVVIVNTSRPGWEADDEDRRSGGVREEEPGEGELLGRAWRIGRILAKAGFRELRARQRQDGEEGLREAAQRFRAALDELGPTFAKLGQILSTRPDLLPPVFIEELSSLQERVTPLTEAEVVSVMEAELQVPWEDVFNSIDPKPLAAGTIAQVHRATLESGQHVVVKVQRPNAEADILEDLGLLEMFARKAAQRPAMGHIFDIPAMIEHLSSSLRRELDFRQEAANIERMGEVLEPFSRLDVPKVFKEYSTARLLVMEEIPGVSVLDAPPSEARDEAALQLLEAYYHQVMTEGFFHADPHPGNLKWWNDTIYFLDLGMVGEVEGELRRLILLLLLAFAQGDGGFLAEVVLMVSAAEGPSRVLNYQQFQEDLEGLVARYRNLSLREIQLGPLLQEVTQIAVRHNVRIPASLTLIGKAFAQMQLVAGQMNPSIDPFSVAESFVMRSTLRRLNQNLNPQKLFYETQKAQLRFDRLLTGIEGVVGARPSSHLQVDFRGTERMESQIALASQRVSIALGLGGTLAVAAVTAGSPRVPRWVPAVMSGIGSALAARLLLDRPNRKQ